MAKNKLVLLTLAVAVLSFIFGILAAPFINPQSLSPRPRVEPPYHYSITPAAPSDPDPMGNQCDANNNCSEGESCYSYPELGFNRCVSNGANHCDFCPSGNCIVSPAEIFPPNVICK